MSNRDGGMSRGFLQPPFFLCAERSRWPAGYSNLPSCQAPISAIQRFAARLERRCASWCARL